MLITRHLILRVWNLSRFGCVKDRDHHPSCRVLVPSCPMSTKWISASVMHLSSQERHPEVRYLVYEYLVAFITINSTRSSIRLRSVGIPLPSLPSQHRKTLESRDSPQLCTTCEHVSGRHAFRDAYCTGRCNGGDSEFLDDISRQIQHPRLAAYSIDTL